MQFVFWQNIISIHQSTFLSTLSNRHSILLVVEQRLDQERKGDGWNIPDMGKTKIVVAPDDKTIDNLILGNKDAIHVFSGINAFPMVYKAFKKVVALNLQILVYVEPYVWFGVKGFLRRLKYMTLNFRYGKNINGLLVTGKTGRRCFLKAGFSEQKIFDWGYFTIQRSLNEDLISNENGQKPSVLYVGRIDHNKNVLSFVDVCLKHRGKFACLDIIGTGPLSGLLIKKIDGIECIKYLGGKTNDEVLNFMRRYDILVLPSLYDGWGAVVNEALQNGMRVIASENCGASVLLDGKDRGEAFSFVNKEKSLEKILLKWLEKGKVSLADRQKITEWARYSISGDTVAVYFEKICSCVSGDCPRNEVIAPWLK